MIGWISQSRCAAGGSLICATIGLSSMPSPALSGFGLVPHAQTAAPSPQVLLAVV